MFFAAASASPAAAFSLGRKKKPEPVAVTPPPEPEIAVGPPVLSSYVVSQASAYATYMRSASAVHPPFADGPAIASALRIGVASEQRQMQQGMVAYAAIVALQDPAFTATVRGFARHASTRDSLIRYILTDPNYVLTLSGHESAAGLVRATLGAQGAAVRDAGEAVRRSSYDIQLKSPWSKKPVPDQGPRLLDVKQLSTMPVVPAEDLKAQLTQASNGSAPLSLAPGAPHNGPYSQAVVRGLAIAALAILGKATDADAAYLTPLLVNDGDGFCFNMSKLNLYQCLSVARPYYEDVYCLGLHALADTGRCVIGSLGPDPVVPLTVTAVTAAAPAVAGISASAPIATSTR